MSAVLRTRSVFRVKCAALKLFQGYLSFYSQDHSSEAGRQFVQDRLTAGDSLIYLAFADEYPVGVAQVYPTFSSLSLARSWVLNDLFVDSAARGSGVGRALLRTITAEAAAAGAVNVALETAGDNSRAQGLYESEGFVAETDFRHYSRPTSLT
ncbi:GNAT family N-acetyltransferase [Arthrobacter sp. UYCu712]|uniref:GNAT family N-acetyltransferase n=1 Tax=Arthrobacter sp. UYCu712 TaxID=3156340 RepID=UPI00339AD91B